MAHPFTIDIHLPSPWMSLKTVGTADGGREEEEDMAKEDEG